MHTLATEGGGDADAGPGEQCATTTVPVAVLPVEQLMESNASPGAAAAPMLVQHVALKKAPLAPPPAEGADAAAEGGGLTPEGAEGGTEPSPEAPAEAEQAAALV